MQQAVGDNPVDPMGVRYQKHAYSKHIIICKYWRDILANMKNMLTANISSYAYIGEISLQSGRDGDIIVQKGRGGLFA